MIWQEWPTYELDVKELETSEHFPLPTGTPIEVLKRGHGGELLSATLMSSWNQSVQGLGFFDAENVRRYLDLHCYASAATRPQQQGRCSLRRKSLA
jgi:hypothetical protein